MSTLTPWMVLVYTLCIPLAVLGVWLVGHRPPISDPPEGVDHHATPRGTPSTPDLTPPREHNAHPLFSASNLSLIDRLKMWRSQLTPPSRMVSGLCMILLAYHAAAYVSPDHWFGLKVPLERWYILLGGISLALCGTLAIDRFEASSNQPPPSH